MKVWSNITVRNVLLIVRNDLLTVKNVQQVYMTKTTIFYVISSKTVRTANALTDVGGSNHLDFGNTSHLSLVILVSQLTFIILYLLEGLDIRLLLSNVYLHGNFKKIIFLVVLNVRYALLVLTH